MTLPKINYSLLFTRAALFTFAVFLQIQITLFPTPEYIGLRVNAADLILPFVGLFVLGSLLLKRSHWPQWQKPFGYWVPILLTVVLMFALYNGYRVQGSWSSWALINKGVGWFVLMAYLAFGAWASTNQSDEIRKWFLRPFLLFFCAFAVFEIVLRLLAQNGLLERSDLFMHFFRTIELAGFMANRNAYAFLFLSMISIGSLYLIKPFSLHKVEHICFRLLWFMLPAFIAMNASRAAFLVIGPLVLFVIFMNWRVFIKQLLPLILIGCLIVPLVKNEMLAKALSTYGNVSQGAAVLGDDFDLDDDLYHGDHLRLQVILDSKEMYMRHPFTGAGIGSVYEYQKTQQDRDDIAIIDNTPLWVFVEMGPLGFIVFAAAFFSMMIALSRKSKGEIDTHDKMFAHAVIFVMISFGIFSLLHEIMYSRFFWVLLGMGLALPIAANARSDQ